MSKLQNFVCPDDGTVFELKPHKESTSDIVVSTGGDLLQRFDSWMWGRTKKLFPEVVRPAKLNSEISSEYMYYVNAISKLRSNDDITLETSLDYKYGPVFGVLQEYHIPYNTQASIDVIMLSEEAENGDLILYYIDKSISRLDNPYHAVIVHNLTQGTQNEIYVANPASDANFQFYGAAISKNRVGDKVLLLFGIGPSSSKWVSVNIDKGISTEVERSLPPTSYGYSRDGDISFTYTNDNGDTVLVLFGVLKDYYGYPTITEYNISRDLWETVDALDYYRSDITVSVYRDSKGDIYVISTSHNAFFGEARAAAGPGAGTPPDTHIYNYQTKSYRGIHPDVFSNFYEYSRSRTGNSGYYVFFELGGEVCAALLGSRNRLPFILRLDYILDSLWDTDKNGIIYSLDMLLLADPYEPIHFLINYYKVELSQTMLIGRALSSTQCWHKGYLYNFVKGVKYKVTESWYNEYSMIVSHLGVITTAQSSKLLDHALVYKTEK